jgi:DNA polymerase III subunit gamma/tau
MALGASTITAADVNAMLGTADNSRLLRLIQMLAQRDTAAALGEFGASIQGGADVGQLFDQLLGSLRDLMVVAVGCSSSSLVHHLPNDFATIQALALELGLETILAMIQIVDQTLGRLKYLSQPRTLAELALVRMSRLSELQNVSQIIGALRSGTVPSLTIEVQGSSNNGSSKKKVELNEVRLAEGEVLHDLDSDYVDGNGHSSVEQSSDDDRRNSTLEPSATYSSNGHNNGNGHGSSYDSRTAHSIGSVNGNIAARSATTLDVEANGTDGVDQDDIVEQSSDDQAESQKPSIASSTHALTIESVNSAWPEVVSQLPGMLHDSANMGIVKEFRAPNQIVLGFARAHAFAKQLCEKPANLALLQQGFLQATGHDVRFSVVFDEAAPTDVKPATRSAPTAPKVPQQERLQQPFVKKTMDLFAGRVMRIEEPS